MFKFSLGLMVAVEFLSLAAFVSKSLALPLLLLAGVVVFMAAWYRLEWGIYLLFGELFFGSRGHLLEYSFVSLRLVVFIAVFTAWIIREIQNSILRPCSGLMVSMVEPSKFKSQKFNSIFKIYQDTPRVYWLFLFVVVIGAIHGFFRGNGVGNVFFDANGYLYLAILPAVLAGIRTKEAVNNLFKILSAAILIIAAKTVLLFCWFSLGWAGVATLYHWVIQQDIGEITGNVGQASRIFMQSQFYALTGVFIFVLSEKKNWLIIAAALLAVILSLSRSFWLGGIVAAIFVAAMLIGKLGFGLRKLGRLGGGIILIVVIEIIAILLFSQFVGRSESLGSRMESPAAEAAGSARLLLLPPLLTEIQKSLLFGQGFGKTVTYRSFLPDRTTPDNPEGKITSYAFEWGYLDIILKIGLIGLLVYLLFIASIFKKGFSKFQIPNSKFQILGILAGMVALLVLNITTPYLNHPLGIGYLILAYATFISSFEN